MLAKFATAPPDDLHRDNLRLLGAIENGLAVSRSNAGCLRRRKCPASGGLPCGYRYQESGISEFCHQYVWQLSERAAHSAIYHRV